MTFFLFFVHTVTIYFTVFIIGDNFWLTLLLLDQCYIYYLVVKFGHIYYVHNVCAYFIIKIALLIIKSIIFEYFLFLLFIYFMYIELHFDLELKITTVGHTYIYIIDFFLFFVHTVTIYFTVFIIGDNFWLTLLLLDQCYIYYLVVKFGHIYYVHNVCAYFIIKIALLIIKSIIFEYFLFLLFIYFMYIELHFDLELKITRIICLH